MQTKYGIGDTVLLMATVGEIKIDEPNGIVYALSIKGKTQYYRVSEDQIAGIYVEDNEEVNNGQ